MQGPEYRSGCSTQRLHQRKSEERGTVGQPHTLSILAAILLHVTQVSASSETIPKLIGGPRLTYSCETNRQRAPAPSRTSQFTLPRRLSTVDWLRKSRVAVESPLNQRRVNWKIFAHTLSAILALQTLEVSLHLAPFFLCKAKAVRNECSSADANAYKVK